ncbi:hypothetical protein STCU_10519 [Strigomonas culicis]|uniref:Uncharacterized protein n=1 Tax=Strigomonas culicis TaxID=28005 RepID=S9THS3_9TRYP|nr:hypothetical protein STCU_10519 [Strigomonas culicis]|eukprot:EPY17582.1 hypothetical protein STCU_10519 [Strigomonas culicis]
MDYQPPAAHGHDHPTAAKSGGGGGQASNPLSSVQSHGVRIASFLLQCLSFTELQAPLPTHPRLRYYFGAVGEEAAEVAAAAVQLLNRKDPFFAKYGLAAEETTAAALLKCLLFWFDHNHHPHPPLPSVAALAAAAAATAERARSRHAAAPTEAQLRPVVAVTRKVDAKLRWNIARALAAALQNMDVYEAEPFLYYEAVYVCLYVIQEDAIFKVRTQAALALAHLREECVELPPDYRYAAAEAEEEEDPVLIVILQTIVRALQQCQRTSTFFQYREQHALRAALLAALDHCWRYTGGPDGVGAVPRDAWDGLAAALAELPSAAASAAP